MNPKLMKAGGILYECAEWSGGNTSGHEPLADKVLVKTDTVQVKTKGGIYIADDISDRQNVAATTGILAGIGPLAFLFTGKGDQWVGEKPEVGSRVSFEKFAGIMVSGEDGAEYRIMSDTCIASVMKR